MKKVVWKKQSTIKKQFGKTTKYNKKNSIEKAKYNKKVV